MEITSSGEGSDAVLVLNGDLDISSADKVESALMAMIDSKGDRITIDLSAVPFADSSGLGGLIAAYKKAKEQGKDIILRKPSPILTEILMITRMNRFFKIEE